MFIASCMTLHRLRKNQWLKPSELEEIQRRKLKRIIKHAYENVKYYRKLFDSVGVKPEDIRTVEDLCKIPILTKSQLQNLPKDEITAQNFEKKRFVTERTSGSTGMPLDIILTEKEKEFFYILRTRAHIENGLRLKDKKVAIWSIPHVGTSKYWFQHLGIMRREFVYFHDKKSDPLKAIHKANPEIISSVPSIFKLLATEVKKRKNIHIAPRAIYSHGEMLEQETRDLVESTFNVKMFDYYGSVESGLIGWECSEHKNFHLNIDTTVVEFIKDGTSVKPGEKGELICTNLHSFAMPLIRYNIGDIGIPSDKQCPCGRGLPLMERLEGRSEDIIKLPNGTMIVPTTFYRIMQNITGIKQYKITQEKKDKLIIYLVKGNDFEQSIPGQIRASVNKVLQEEIYIIIAVVDSIPEDSSRKHRSVLSKVKTCGNTL